MATKLQIEDVTNVAENDDSLKERYKQVTGVDGKIEEVIPNPASVRGPFTYKTAIIIWLNSNIGTVKVFLGDTNVETWQTSPGGALKVIMVFLEPGYYSWWTNGAKVKFIR
ncbi:hypothetical protein BGW36DRAFT_39134 [Talaromyces proteolyticus]|uniref:Uncharacterized protein n=1 Tax=Talaromyces proteolyticus TaxID=1131652 RepID=A0AAD4KLA7_9EURO|nr:uncharacterized protein BGW36DRAFT_39134 [Talaromyces proteolyticus]KAH8691866.1 hypothetical protein BGW36DRAFT_39134 [Talaromyces proteolyticus]